MSDSFQNGAEKNPASADAEPFDTLLARIVGTGDGSENDYVRLADLFFDLVRSPGDRTASEQKQLDIAFDCLASEARYLSLHRLILTRHSTEGAKKGALATVALKFGPRLIQLAGRDDAPGHGVLIALLLLRSCLPESETIRQLPRWHRERIPAFSAEESLLLYNTMFAQRSFLGNVSELKAALPSLDWLGQWQQHGLKKVNTFLYYWPDGADASRLVALLQAVDSAEPVPTDQIPWADFRTALLRAIGSDAAQFDPGLVERLHGNQARLWGAMKQYGLGRLGLAGRRPRVAICISGQLRGYEAALQSWRKHLLPGIEADFFVHSWKQVGRSGSEPFRRFLPFEGAEFQKCYREQCLKMGYDTFVEHYPQLFTALATSGEVSVDHVKAVYGTEHVILEDDSAPEFAEWGNSRKMHYKVAQVQALAEKSGKEYDMMMRIRPDKAMRLLLGSWTALSRMVNREAIILADVAMGVHYGNLMIGDQFALGSPASMGVYSAMYSDAEKLEASGKAIGNTYFQGHVSLARQCFLNNIHVGKFPAIFAGLLGASPLSSKEIQLALAADSAGRLDQVDRSLLEAVKKDITAT